MPEQVSQCSAKVRSHCTIYGNRQRIATTIYPLQPTLKTEAKAVAPLSVILQPTYLLAAHLLWLNRLGASADLSASESLAVI